MTHAIEAFLLQNGVERRHVRKVRLGEREPLAAGLSQVLQPVPFQFDRVIVVQIVDTDHIIAAGQKPVAERRAYEARSSRNQDATVTPMYAGHLVKFVRDLQQPRGVSTAFV